MRKSLARLARNLAVFSIFFLTGSRCKTAAFQLPQVLHRQTWLVNSRSFHGAESILRRDVSIDVSTCPIFDSNEPTNYKTNEEADAIYTKKAPKQLNRATEIGFLIASLRGKPHKYLAKLQKKHGENFIIQPNIVVLNDPKAIRDVLEKHNLPKTPKVRFGYKSIFYGSKSRSSGGILAAPWNKWIEQRRMATPALSECVIGELAPKFRQASAPFFAYLDSMAAAGQPVDMSAAFTAVTMDIIGKILMDASFGMCDRLNLEGQGKEAPFATALHTLTEEAVRQMVLPSWWLNRRQKDDRVETARQVIDNVLEDCIESRLTIWGTGEISRRNTTDLLNILLEAERDGAISRDEVKGQLLQFVFAGFDTLAPTLTFMLWEISQNQKLQSDLLSEAKAALPNHQDFPMKPDSLTKRVPLMDATFSETNRKHPAAAMGASRKVGRKPIIVGDGLELPADASVLISPWTLHRNERLWHDPERFDPSRFENPPKDPFSYQPFSGGPRNCIGIKLARAETLSVFVPLIRRFHVKSTSQRVPDDYFSLTRRPRRPVTFILTSRAD